LRNHRAAVTCVVALLLVGFGQAEVPQVDWEMTARIREEGFQRSQLADTLSYMTDVLGARLTVSPGMRRAQRWAIGEMERIGLANIKIEPFMDYGISWSNDYVSLHLLEPDYQPMVGYPLSHTPGTNGALQLQVVIADVRTRRELERLRGTLNGKAVLSTPPPVINLARINAGVPRLNEADLRDLEQPAAPRPPQPAPNPDILSEGERMAFFKAEGVDVVLRSSTGTGRPGVVGGASRPGTRVDHWGRQESLDSLPIVALTPEHYNRMYRVIQRGIDVRIEVDVRNTIGDEMQQAANVLGEIPGSDLAGQVVMLGAHFDTWHASPNASDNTSGVAVMLEAARILTALDVHPRRTIRLALWSGEEQGLFGSRAYVKKHFGDPDDPEVGVSAAYTLFSVYFNQDYGVGKFRGVYLQGNEHVRRMFTAWMEPFRDLGMTTLSPRSVGSTDHVPFDAAGLPAFQFLQDRAGGTAGHTNLDFFDTLPIEDLKHNAVIVAAFVYHAAMSDEPVPRKGR
jgi:carboxypeptidase Q